MPVPSLDDRGWLHRRYAVDLAPVADIAAEASRDPSSVYRALARHGIAPRGPAGRASHDVDRDELAERIAHGQTLASIAADYGCDPAVIYDRRVRWGLVEPRELGASPAQLRMWYDRYGWSVRRVADRLGVTPRTARRRLMAAGVQLRPPGRPRATGD